MMRQSFFAIKAGLATLVLIGAVETAAAQSVLREHADRRDMVVSYRDLDLSDARDAAILLNRIDKAAEAACGGRPWLADPFNEDVSSSMRETYRHCHADAMARAVEKVDAPLVKQLNQPSG